MVSSVRRGTGPGHSRPARLAVVLLCGWLAAGCGLLGKPQPLSADAPLTMSVTSPDFRNGQIPSQFLCHGGVSPPIFWSGAPPRTKSLAVVIDDSEAPISPKVYWIVFDISPSTTDLQSGALPPPARTAYNTAGTPSYNAPCPTGHSHKYRFTVYALNKFLGSSLPAHPELLQAWTAIAAHVIARGTLTAYGKAQPNSGARQPSGRSAAAARPAG